MSNLFKIGFLLLMLTFSSLDVSATNYYVNNNSTAGDVYCSSTGNNANNGTSPSTPKATLANVLSTYSASLTSGDRIYVDAGTYNDVNLILNRAGIRISGAGPAKTIFDNASASADANNFVNITANNITIDGCLVRGYNRVSAGSAIQITAVTGVVLNNVLTDNNKAGGGSSTIVITGPSSSVTFNGGGSNCNTTTSVAGGGVNVEGNGNVITFNNYSFSNNSKDLQPGSALYVVGDNTTTVTVNNSIVADNRCLSSGGAVFVTGANLNISGSYFNNNSNYGGSGPKYGGAITVGRGATVTVSNCNFVNNAVSNSGNGGAISINTGISGSGSTATVNLTACSFTGNTATSGNGNHLYARVGSSNPAIFNINQCSFGTSTTSILNGNTATFNIQNSASPSSSGSMNFINTLTPTSTPITSYPTLQGSCYGIVLPVEFLDFSGACKLGSNDLHWSTAAEHNNAYFTIERAGNDVPFSEIATIQGSQTTTELTNYYFQDAMPLRGLNYYRLTQTDMNGDSQILKTISVDNNKCLEDHNGMYVFADQSGEYVTIDHAFESHRKMNIEIYNSIGQLVETQSLQLESAVSRTQIHLRSSFSNGMYFLKLSDSSEAFTEKFMIRKQ
jgi:hypothetical protein